MSTSTKQVTALNKAPVYNIRRFRKQRDVLLEIEKGCQEKWDKEKVFEIDAPGVIMPIILSFSLKVYIYLFCMLHTCLYTRREKQEKSLGE